MSAEAVVADLDIERLVHIDRQIDENESTALRARWEFGQQMLAARDGAGRLPNGYLRRLVDRTGKSTTELGRRARFASMYPTEEELAHAVGTFPSWHELAKALKADKDAEDNNELREYLQKIDAPADALEHITKVLAWKPPPLWEARHVLADAINQNVEPPEGMRHVGWYCEHPVSRKPPYERDPAHREHSSKNKRGWKVAKNTSRSLSFGDYDTELACPQRVPIFIRETS